MRNATSESDRQPLRRVYDRRQKLTFDGPRVATDTGLPAYRERDNALGLTAMAGSVLAMWQWQTGDVRPAAG